MIQKPNWRNHIIDNFKKNLFALAIIIIGPSVVSAHTDNAILNSADPNTYLQGANTLMQVKWPSNRAINIVCHGHSVPAGYFKTPAVDSLNAYPHLLYESLKKKYPYAVINVIVTAIGGETSDKGARRFAEDVLTHKPDIILIDYCLNDRRIGLEKARIAWESMIRESLKQKIKVILLTPTADTNAKLSDTNDPLNLHAAQVRTLAAKYNVALVDSLAEIKTYIKAGGKLKDLMSQGNHPNHKGHELVAKAIMEWFDCETKRVATLQKGSCPPTAFAYKKDTATWLEAESTCSSRGLEVDSRKADVTSRTKSLCIDALNLDKVNCQWDFSLTKDLSDKNNRLALRYATPEKKETELIVELDGKIAGKIKLPKTSGWGYSLKEWNWAVVKLDMHLKAGTHSLKITTISQKPWNLDCLAFYQDGTILLENAVNVKLKRYFSTPAIELPKWKGIDDEKLCDINMGGKETNYKIWTGSDSNRFYPDEFLPALFRRTIVFDKSLAEDSLLQWKFTGPRAAFDIQISAETITLKSRFYDTPVYNEINGKATRHPEWSPTVNKWAYCGELKAVTVQIDQGMNLRVSLNSKLIMERKWGFDISRHQFELGNKDDMSLELLGPKTVKATVNVLPNKTHQKMIGFGGIATPTAYNQLSNKGKRHWWNWLCEYNLLIQREYPNGRRLNESMDNWDNLKDATPHYYSSNFPNGEISDFRYNKLVFKLGGQIWFEFWKLPAWVNTDIEKYAQAIIDYCRTSVQKSGRAPQIVGIQNEHRQSAERLHDMVITLRQELDKAGFEDVKIHMSNLPFVRDGIKEVLRYKQSENAWSKIDYSATNIYDYQNHFYNIDGFDDMLKKWKQTTVDKPFLAVEICIQRAELQLPGYRPALIMGQLYQKNLTIADASALIYCWSLLNIIEPSFGWSRSLFVVDRQNGFVPKPSSNQLRVFGAYSRRVKGGMVRINANADNKDLLVCAFKGTDGKATVVAVNRSIYPMKLQLNWPDVEFSECERVSPYFSNQAESFSGNSVVLAGGEIVTLTNVKLNNLPINF